MKWLKRLPILVMAVVALLTAAVPAYAHEVPDAERLGSVSLTMTYDGTKVPGGTVTLYRVGDVVADDGNYDFALTESCAESDVSLEDVQSPDAAQALAGFVRENDLRGTTASIASDGTVAFDDLEIGLYLVTQDTPAEGYRAFDPFLVGVPLNDEGTYVYDVDASPKLELAKAPQTPPQGDMPSTGEPASVVPFVLGAGAVVCAFAAGMRRVGVKR